MKQEKAILEAIASMVSQLISMNQLLVQVASLVMLLKIILSVSLLDVECQSL